MHTLSDKFRFVQRKLKPAEVFTTKKWMVFAVHLLAQPHILNYYDDTNNNISNTSVCVIEVKVGGKSKKMPLPPTPNQKCPQLKQKSSTPSPHPPQPLPLPLLLVCYTFYSVGTSCCKPLAGSGPAFLSELLHVYTPSHTLVIKLFF